MKAKKFIEILQKTPDGKPRETGMLEKAVEVGFEVTMKLIEKFPDPVTQQGRFRSLLFALVRQNPTLREDLLNDAISATDFVIMEEKDLADEDLKKKKAE